MKESTEQYSATYLTDASRFIDQHIRLIRYIGIGSAICGLLLIGRSTRLLTRFENISQIPDRFFTRHVKLQGKIKSVELNGHLKIYHKPLVSIGYKSITNQSPLTISLAGIDMHYQQPIAIKHLKSNLLDKNVWFKLMAKDNQLINCIVTYRPKYFLPYVNVNEELVRKGLALPKDYKYINQTDNFWKDFYCRLKVAEDTAIKKNVGVWKKNHVSFVDRIRSFFKY